jgi:hypothetical protein
MQIWMRWAVVTTLSGVPLLAQAPRGPQTPPVVGVVKSFDGKTVVVTTKDGADAPITVPATVMVSFNAKRTLADIKPGDFVASGGTRGPDGVIRANEIRIFSGVRGEGQFPMAGPNQVMTNATVTQVTSQQVMTNATVKQVGSAGGTPVIKLSFHGAGAPGSPACTGRAADAPGGAGSGCVGETEFEVPANVAVVAQLPGDVGMLKPGAKASVNVMVSADGVATAQRITISE